MDKWVLGTRLEEGGGSEDQKGEVKYIMKVIGDISCLSVVLWWPITGC